MYNFIKNYKNGENKINCSSYLIYNFKINKKLQNYNKIENFENNLKKKKKIIK